MNIRPAPLPDAEYIDEPIDWAAISPEERAFIQEGIDAIDRGEFITHEEMQVEFQRMRDRLAKR